ncbi:MAG: hypothetical protein WC157_01560 [Candidatus Paceibacterota bacterium]
MKVLIVDKKKPKELFENAKKVALEFKEIEVAFLKDESGFYELPLVVINNVIVSSGESLSKEELRKVFKDFREGCSGCNKCG